MSAKADSKSNFNTAYRLCVDSLVAVAAGFSLSWFITPMDIAVMESVASNKQITVKSSLQQSFKQILRTPHRYMLQPQFGYVFGTYSATYLATNYIDTICKKTNQNAEQTAFYKVWLVFAVNGGLSLFFDLSALSFKIVFVSCTIFVILTYQTLHQFNCCAVCLTHTSSSRAR